MTTTTTRVEATHADRSVRASGYSLARAVQAAVRELGLGVGGTRSKTLVAPGHWRWDWSGHILDVRVLGTSGPAGETTTPEERKAAGLKRVEAWLDGPTREKLDGLARRHGGVKAALVAAIELAAGTGE